MRKPLSLSLFFLILLSHVFNIYSQSYVLQSPNLQVGLLITIGNDIHYSVFYYENMILDRSVFQLQVSQDPVFGKDISVLETTEKDIDETWKPVIGKHAEVRNHCRELTIEIQENRFPERKLILVFRAYNDGIAYRYMIPESWSRFSMNHGQLPLTSEYSLFRFPGDHKAWVADYGSYASHQESEFKPVHLSEIEQEAVLGLPLLVRISDQAYAAITEANLTDWAGMYLGCQPCIKPGEYALFSKLSPLPGEGAAKVLIKPGTPSPWRVVMLGTAPGDLIESEIINNLNDPCVIQDPSWIRPGISAWDHWWSGDVQMDTKTIKQYIQLASDMGWEYMLIDWHWYGAPFMEDGSPNPDADITTVNPAVNMPEVIRFAKENHVNLVLWLLWNHVDKQMDEAFALYEKWGISGVKIDFMARDDQEMVNWYHNVVKKAAEHKLVVDFHGAYKPTGWSRTWPNLLTREGVMGNEYSKWSARITPEHNVTLPFTRMLTGPMDYTPGAFLNVTPAAFRNGSPAEVMNTRCQQLAMFVVYYSPFTVACDHPANYKNQPGIEFLKEVPTTWDDTHVLTGEVGKYVVIARKKDNRWYLGGMSDSDSRGVTIKLDFLQPGDYTLHYFKDANDSDTHPEHLQTGTEHIKSGQYYFIKFAPGGGFAGWIE